MKKLFKTIIVTAIALMMFAAPTFAMSSVPTSCIVEGVADEGTFKNGYFRPNTSTNVPITGTTAYIKVAYNGYGRNDITLSGSPNATYSEVSTNPDMAFGTMIGWETVYKVINLTPGSITSFKICRFPNRGTTVPNDTVYIKSL